MTVKEIREQHIGKDGSSIETVMYQIDANEGFYLAKDGYAYGNSVMTDDPNGWKEIPLEG